MAVDRLEPGTMTRGAVFLMGIAVGLAVAVLFTGFHDDDMRPITAEEQATLNRAEEEARLNSVDG